MLEKYLMAFLMIVPLFSGAQTQYIVRKGDTLLKIADRILGNTKPNDPRRYELAKKIQSLNPHLKNPNALEPSQTITLPGQEKAVSLAPPTHPAATFADPVPEVLPPSVPEQPAPVPPVIVNSESLPTPTPVPVPPVPNAVQKPETHDKHSEHTNFVLVQPRLQTLQISTKETATGTKAKMKSDSSVGLDLQYGFVLNHRFHLLFQAGITQTTFGNIEGDATSVNHKSETLTSYALGIGYEATSKLHLDLMVMYADRTFLLPEVLPAYLLESVTIPGAEFNISWDAFTTGSNIFGISAIAEYIGQLKKNNVDYKSTLESIVALYWKTNRGHDHINYKMTLSYKKGHQDTSLTEQKEDVTSFGVGFYF